MIKTICSYLGSADVHTDEGYRKVLLRRQRFFVGMLVMGVVTCTVAAMAEFLRWDVALSSHALGFYSGMGTGAAFGAGVFLFRLRRTMRNPDRLHKARIAATDERTLEISRRALAAAGYILLLAVYLVCIIGGLFYPEMLMALAVLVMVFLLAYVVSYLIYNRIM